MSKCLNFLSPRSFCRRLERLQIVCIVGVLLCATRAVAFPIISIKTETLSLGADGALTYTVTNEFTNCTGSKTATFELWSYTKFIYTDQFGIQHSLSGTADYIIAPPQAQICVQSGSFPVTLSGTLYTITFTPSANGGASATIHLEPGYVNLRYVVVGVTYAPPGPASSVQYIGTSLFGTTQTVSDSFANANSKSISVSGGGGVKEVFEGKITATFDATTSMTTKDTKTVTTTFQVQNGEKTGGTPNYFAPVDHDYDLVWVWLNPVAIFTIVDGSAVWNGYGYDAADQPNPEIVPIELGYLNGRFGTIPPDKAIPLARSWAAKQIFPPGQGPAITSAELAQIASADPFSVASYGTNFIGQTPPTETSDTRFTQSPCTQGGSINYVQAAPSGGPIITPCTINYMETTVNTQDISSTYQQTFSIDVSMSGTPFMLAFGADLKTANTLTWTTEQQNSITTTTGSSASLSVQGPPCNSVTPGVGPCVPVYDALGNQPTAFEVYQDNKYGTFMFAPIHYY